MIAKRSELTSEDANVFDLLNEASKQYDVYVQIAEIAEKSVLAVGATEPQRSWGHPMGLVVSQTRS